MKPHQNKRLVVYKQWCVCGWRLLYHYSNVIMNTMVSQITSLTSVYSTIYSGADERKHQSSASLAFVRGIHRWPMNSPHKGPVTRKMFPFDDVIMTIRLFVYVPLQSLCCRVWISLMLLAKFSVASRSFEIKPCLPPVWGTCFLNCFSAVLNWHTAHLIIAFNSS